jgi:hypothetical protein
LHSVHTDKDKDKEERLLFALRCPVLVLVLVLVLVPEAAAKVASKRGVTPSSRRLARNLVLRRDKGQDQDKGWDKGQDQDKGWDQDCIACPASGRGKALCRLSLQATL